MFDRLIDTVTRWLALLRVIVVIQPYQQAVIVRLGKFSRVVSEGWHWIFPLGIEQCYEDNIVRTTSNLGSQSLTTSDNKTILLSPIVTWKIRDIRKFLLEVEDAETVLADSVYGVVSAAVQVQTFKEVNTAEFRDRIYREVRSKAFQFGAEVLDLQFSDLSTSKSIRLMQE